MGSKRDGVPVPYDRHGVRPSRAVRAGVRDGTHPSVADEAPRHKRRSRKKPFVVEYRGVGAQDWKRWWGRHETAKAARQAAEGLARGGSVQLRGHIETRVVELDNRSRPIRVVPDGDGDS